MTLHTGPGCSISNDGLFSGSITTPNCYVNAPGQGTNAGCQITTTNSQSYGTGFNANGGGVYATEWTSEHINIYFFPRGSIPGDVASGNPDPSTWGTALASFSGGFEIDSFFQNQQIVRGPLIFSIPTCHTNRSYLRSSTQPSAATGLETSGLSMRPAVPKRPPASRSSRTTPRLSRTRTGQSTLSKSTSQTAQLRKVHHQP